MFKNEIVFLNHEKGLEVAKALLNENYVVLLSYKKNLLILNYELSECGADRSDIVFMSRNEYEEENSKHYEEIVEGIRYEIRNGLIQSLEDI